MRIFLTALLLTAIVGGGVAAEGKEKTPAELEKETALANPYANDFGPEELDKKVLAGYPAPVQTGYKVFKDKCSVCHSIARPLNSEFLEAPGAKVEDREKELAGWKKTHPEYFAGKNKFIWKPEAKIWQRFVKRMMSKPGCTINNSEAKQIWAFLSHDSLARKTGKNQKAWVEHREKLLADFKKKNPLRYKELYAE